MVAKRILPLEKGPGLMGPGKCLAGESTWIESSHALVGPTRSSGPPSTAQLSAGAVTDYIHIRHFRQRPRLRPGVPGFLGISVRNDQSSSGVPNAWRAPLPMRSTSPAISLPPDVPRR